jgi:hypothetical protein
MSARTSPALRRADVRSAGGFALLAVLLVLLALLVLSAPFLLTVRNADRASAELSDRVRARIALDSAARYARAELGATHPGVDDSPYWDDEQELAVEPRFDPAFLDAQNERGLMWDVEARDLAGLVDLGSASPHLLANLIGGSTLLMGDVGDEVEALSVISAAGFPPAGYVWLRGETVKYGRIEGASFAELERGIGSAVDADGNELPCGPRPASEHAAGAVVIDERALALAQWRLRGLAGAAPGELRPYASRGQLSEAGAQSFAGALGAEALAALERTSSAHGGVRGGREWQHAARVESQVRGGFDCSISVSETRWFNPGTTVRVSQGERAELAIVQEVLRNRGIRLMQPLANSYDAWAAEIAPLARRPVNANTASAEVLRALFLHVHLHRSRARTSSSQADELARLVIASRPLLGLQDFLERVILPAAGLAALPADAPVVPEIIDPGAGGGGFLNQELAIALYRNALNSNDAELGFATAPLCFGTREVFELALRASANAPSGAQRSARARLQTELIAPQTQLMSVWTRQEDFDEAFRLDGGSPWWMSGPRATTRPDPLFLSVPPSLAAAHLGVHGIAAAPGAQPEDAPDVPPTFAQRAEGSWLQLWPSRESELGQRQGKVIHFDWEARDAEGRYLPDEPLVLATDDPRVAWEDTSGLLRAFGLDLWLQPRGLKQGDVLLDVAGATAATDRVALTVDNGELVLSVRDAAGDHPDTSFIEEGRASIALGAAPGLPDGIWSHLALDVRGNRADQIELLVDGFAQARTPGRTRLTGSLDFAASSIPVESTEGFPDTCVLRIGDELIEARVAGPGSFLARFETQGINAGFGGRQAREAFDLSSAGSGATVEVNQAIGLGKDVDHEQGTTVALYGYSLPLAANASNAQASLPAPLGRFAVARARRAVLQGSSQAGEPIVLEGVGLTGNSAPVQIGLGIEGLGSAAIGLELEATDSFTTPQEVMAGFNPSGGYAALVNRSGVYEANGATLPLETMKGNPIGGVELIWYSGWSGTTLSIGRRGHQLTELAKLQGGNLPDGIGGSRAFVIDHGDVTTAAGQPLNQYLGWSLFVLPISIPVPGGGGALGFPSPPGADSEFAQITRLGADRPLTEWVRYDEVASEHLVRDDPLALARLQAAVLEDVLTDDVDVPGPLTGNPVGGTAGTGFTAALLDTVPPPTFASASSSAQQPGYQPGPHWHFALGADEDADRPVTRAASSALQFRGVFGTYSHAHPAQTRVLPVLRFDDGPPEGGWPGANDACFLVDANPAGPALPVRVQRAHRPREYVQATWSESAQPGTPAVATSIVLPHDPALQAALYVGLEAAPQLPVAAGGAASGGAGATPVAVDTRMLGRLVLFPSGERPRGATSVRFGGSAVAGGFAGGASATAAVPSAALDELVFGSTDFGNVAPYGGQAQGASMVLRLPFGAGDNACEVHPQQLRTPFGLLGTPSLVLDALPPDAGLLRIGDEIVCYSALDPSSGRVTIAPGGRGLLGSDPQPHAAGECVAWLSHRPVSVLAAPAAATDALLRVEDLAELAFQGTFLLGQELVHATHHESQSLAMPRASSATGAQDRRGPGLFRGRFGTAAQSHAIGTPVIQFPFRYWDRWAPLADAPELGYASFVGDQPGAWWSSVFWTEQPPLAPGARIAVLERRDPRAPWDADPASDPRLMLWNEGMPKGAGNPLRTLADRIEWRVHVLYGADSFDPDGGTAHGWKCSPRLALFGAQYLAPSLVLEAVER